MAYRIFKNSPSNSGYILGTFESKSEAEKMKVFCENSVKSKNMWLLTKGRLPVLTSYEVVECQEVVVSGRKSIEYK